MDLKQGYKKLFTDRSKAQPVSAVKETDGEYSTVVTYLVNDNNQVVDMKASDVWFMHDNGEQLLVRKKDNTDMNVVLRDGSTTGPVVFGEAPAPVKPVVKFTISKKAGELVLQKGSTIKLFNDTAEIGAVTVTALTDEEQSKEITVDGANYNFFNRVEISASEAVAGSDINNLNAESGATFVKKEDLKLIYSVTGTACKIGYESFVQLI